MNFDRQYRFSAGPVKGTGFEVGATSPEQPTALHISFSIQKTDLQAENTIKVSLWNLSPAQLAVLNEKDCVIVLKAGYDSVMPLVFIGAVSFVETGMEGADRMTTIEAIDGRLEIRDTWVSLAYAGIINTKKITEDVAREMGIAVIFSHNAQFADLPDGFSFIGKAAAALDKACASSGLTWSIQNGVLHVKANHDTINREVYLLSPDTGLIGIPKKVNLAAENSEAAGQQGWDAEYLMNAAINVNDYIRLESKSVQGYFRVYSVEINGDNLEGDWLCTARLLEVEPMLPELVQQIKNLSGDMIDAIHTAIPGAVESFDSATGMAVILPAGKMKTNAGKMIAYPKISGVPVVFPQAGGATIAFPIKPGDGCLLIIAEQALDYWRTGAESSTELKFDLTNAIAIPGLLTKVNPVVSEATENDALIVDKEGVRISITAGRIDVLGGSQVNVTAESVQVTAQTLDINAGDISMSAENISLSAAKAISISAPTPPDGLVDIVGWTAGLTQLKP